MSGRGIALSSHEYRLHDRFSFAPHARVHIPSTVSIREWKMKKTFLSIAMIAAAVTPIAAQAHGHDNGRHRGWDKHERGGYRGDDYRGRYDEHRYYDDRRYSRRGDCRSGGTTGLLLGGAAGALLGRAVDTRGERTTGTILGAGAGALLGREVERSGKC
jgi:hypothetical protein